VSVVLSVVASLLQAVKNTAQVKIANNRFIVLVYVTRKVIHIFMFGSPFIIAYINKMTSVHKAGQ
jgi:hypothetical protein